MQILGFAVTRVEDDDDSTGYDGTGHIRSMFIVGGASNWRVFMYRETARCVKNAVPNRAKDTTEMFQPLARCRRYKRRGLGFELLLLPGCARIGAVSRGFMFFGDCLFKRSVEIEREVRRRVTGKKREGN